MWVVVKIMVPFWIPIILQHLIFGGPKKWITFLTTTHVDSFGEFHEESLEVAPKGCSDESHPKAVEGPQWDA